jgi:UDP-N-acetylmuramate dehydrogenase
VNALERAERILRAECGPRIRSSLPLAPLTTFRVGGLAALYLEPESERDLDAAAEAVAASGIPWVAVGKGSNLLVSDRGFPGLVIRLGRSYRMAARDGDRLRAGASLPLPALAGAALTHGLAGMEFGIAIPGTVGGGVRMNAGAHGRSMADVVERIDLYSVPDGRPRSIRGTDAGFAYRHSALPTGALVVGAVVHLAPGDRDAIRGRMDEAREWRRATQPLAEPNCGSVFTNPPNDHAARLVEAAGAKGLSEGGAEVSRKHANFVVTRPGATAADVDRLIRRVQGLVLERFGVHLEPEVQRVGDFDLASL